jgi:hypothetical protein
LWWHQKIVGYHHSVTVEQSLLDSRKSGLLVKWWDLERDRPYLVEEYLNGKPHGHSVVMSPLRRLDHVWSLESGHVTTAVSFDSGGISDVVLRDSTNGIQAHSISPAAKALELQSRQLIQGILDVLPPQNFATKKELPNQTNGR